MAQDCYGLSMLFSFLKHVKSLNFLSNAWIFLSKMILDPFVVHEGDGWVFALLHDLCFPPDLVTTPAHYPSDVTKKKKVILLQGWFHNVLFLAQSEGVCFIFN